MPGGGNAALDALGNPSLRAYVRSTAETAQFVVSIGTGSLMLAALGLLHDRQATTQWAYADMLEYLGARYVRKPWTEDGTFITAAGVSAGIDLMITFGAKLINQRSARPAQLFAEYDPHPPFGPIDWDNTDDARASVLVQQQAAWHHVLADQPELWGAVVNERPASNLATSGTEPGTYDEVWYTTSHPS